MNTTIENIKQIIKSNGSKFFAVEFVKKDGSTRKINGHLRHVAGADGVNTVAHIDKYITVVLSEKDANGKEQFRNVNCETITALHIGGKRISIR